MSKYLLLRGFNSYLNRVIKRYETLEEYIAAVAPGNYSIRTNMNFFGFCISSIDISALIG